MYKICKVIGIYVVRLSLQLVGRSITPVGIADDGVKGWLIMIGNRQNKIDFHQVYPG